MTSTSAGDARALGAPGALGAVVLVIFAAAATGALTPYASEHLPSSISSVANSSGPWAMVAFVSVFLSRARGLFAAVLGASSLVTMNVVFFFAFEARLGPYSHDAIAFWIGVALVVGPILGLCAGWLRSTSFVLREVAVAAPSSVLVGEGLFMISRQAGLSPTYAHASVVVGLLLFLVLALWRLRRIDRILVSAVMTAAATATFYAAYDLMPLLFNRGAP
jgi:hypothetical protein